MRVPRPIPTGDGPNPSKSTRLCRYRGRRRRVRARQHRARQEPVATNAGCKRGRSCIQLQETRHQDQRDRILRVCVWQGWHQARPEQDRRHTQDAYHTRQGRSATVHRFDELFGGIYTAFRRQGVTVARTPQEGRPIRVARRSPAYL